MAVSPRLLEPRLTQAVATDPDAVRYLFRVRAADGGAIVEIPVQRAIDQFVIGCKADNIWSSLKSCCILMGARTLAGALTPLVGAAPTNANFASSNYDRKTGLLGNGVSRYIITNRFNSDDPRNSQHLCVFVSSAGINSLGGAAFTSDAQTLLSAVPAANFPFRSRQTSGVAGTRSLVGVTGFVGLSRGSSSFFQTRDSGVNQSINASSVAPAGGRPLFIFAGASGTGPSGFSTARIAFYSIGESVDLALLDARVTALRNAIGAAIQ